MNDGPSRHKRIPTILIAAIALLLLLVLVGWYLIRKDIVQVRLKDGRLTVIRSAGREGYDDVFDSDEFRIEHGLTLGGRSVERPDSVYLTLRVPFRIVGGSSLVMAVPNGVVLGDPVEAFMRLMILPPGNARATQLLVMGDLRGRVRIRTPKEALAFCRLLTSPATYCYLDCPGVEVASKDQVDLDLMFGDKEQLSFYRRMKPDGIMGIVNSRSDLAALGIKPASARKTATGFEVRRTLLVEESPFSYKLWFLDVIEAVGKDGSYRRVVTNKRRAPPMGKYTFGIFHPM
jgi:hypothetical protein